MKENHVTIVQDNGAVYELREPRALRLFFRIVGIALAVMGALISLVTPFIGVAALIFGCLLVFLVPRKISVVKKFKSFSGSPLSGCSTFGEWHEKVHRGAAQSDRFERAAHQPMSLLDYRENGVASIVGSSGATYTTTLDYCSCEDFAKRGKPCKHIYFLAIQMGFDSSGFYN